MKVKVSLYVAGKVVEDVVNVIIYEDAKKTSLRRNPFARVVKVSSVI